MRCVLSELTTDRKGTQGKIMFSQASVSHSVHNRPRGYWFTARYASEMLFCLFIPVDSTLTPDRRTGSATINISNTSKRTACPTVN